MRDAEKSQRALEHILAHCLSKTMRDDAPKRAMRRFKTAHCARAHHARAMRGARARARGARALA
eukprot:5706666-Lingulodinium_polyedra.AAC.1